MSNSSAPGHKTVTIGINSEVLENVNSFWYSNRATLVPLHQKYCYVDSTKQFSTEVLSYCFIYIYLVSLSYEFLKITDLYIRVCILVSYLEGLE